MDKTTRVDVHLHLHSDERLIALITEWGIKLGKELDTLTQQVAANTTVDQSAIALINGIAQRITDAGTDPAALTALTASLKTDSDSLAAAVAANTPAAAPPPGTNTPGTITPA